MRKIRERWRSIPGWIKYEASTLGRIRRKAGYDAVGRYWPRRIVHPKGDRCYIRLNQLPRIYDGPVATLILWTFVGRAPKGKKHARHLDDVRRHNQFSNLAWGSAWDNMQDAIRNGLTGKGIPRSKETRLAISRGLKRFHKHRKWNYG